MLVVYYQGPKNEFFEEKALDLANAFRGRLERGFRSENGSFSMIVQFSQQAQEDRYREHLKELSKTLSVSVEFGGYEVL